MTKKMICSQGTCQSLLSVMITDDKKMICSQGTCQSLLSVMITDDKKNDLLTGYMSIVTFCDDNG